MKETYSASANGSLMIVGEHAVLWGTPCIVGTVEQSLSAILEPRTDNRISIQSLYGREEFDMLSIPESRLHRFVTATIVFYSRLLPGGFNLILESNIPGGKGFASSAASVVATQQAILAWTGHPFLPANEKIANAASIVRKVQGYGSGADVAASVLGGIIFYQMNPLKALVIASNLSLVSLFCGYKTPTPEVIRYVEARRLARPAYFEELKEQAAKLVFDARQAITENNMERLGEVFTGYGKVMSQFGVEDAMTRKALDFLGAQEGIYGVKISGSGLGDSVIGCGSFRVQPKLPDDFVTGKMELVPVRIQPPFEDFQQ